jgi:hypothetical protein
MTLRTEVLRSTVAVSVVSVVGEWAWAVEREPSRVVWLRVVWLVVGLLSSSPRAGR